MVSIASTYQNIQEFLNPTAFSVGSFSVRWYSISYIAGFIIIYLVLLYRIRLGEANDFHQITKPKEKIQNTKHKTRDTLLDFLLVLFAAAVIGGRIGYVLFYDLTYFLHDPAAIVSPFDKNGIFVGIYGMSYFGALFGALLAGYLFCKVRHFSFLKWADFIVPAIPAGYFFGRVGNFLNGELYGRITDSPLGMYFSVEQGTLRHPSQLYEAFFEGIFIFMILWLFRNKVKFDGQLLIIYLTSYSFFRIVIEFFRQPGPGELVLGGFATKGQLLAFFVISVCVIAYSIKTKKVIQS